MFGRKINIKAEGFLVCVCARSEAFSFIEAFHALLGDLALFPTALIGIHFQVLGVSPLHTHFAIILLFFMATIIHRIAYMEIKLQPQDAGYLPILRFICLVSGIIAIELLFAIIISPFWLFMVNLCPILILGVLCPLYQQIYQCVCYTANLVRNAVCSFFEKICQAFSSREQEDNWWGKETAQGKRRLNIERFKNCGLVLILVLFSTFGRLF